MAKSSAKGARFNAGRARDKKTDKMAPREIALDLYDV
jgi:hypothetical protein